MDDVPSRDQPETEKLEPSPDLLARRRQRDAQAYRDWCESAYGMIDVGPEVFHPADILTTLAPDAARRGRDDAMTQARTDIERTVCEEFPATVAVPFHGFIEGPREALVRLHRLRDTWESLVRLLASMALSEAASIGPQFAPLELREGADQGWRKCKRRDFTSDKLSVRIGLVEGVLLRASQLGVSLRLTALIPPDVLAEVRRLNVVRNGFSHEATKSETQAQAIIDDAYPVVRELLLDLQSMRSVELMRVQRIRPGNRVEVERLVGHAQSRRVRELELSQQATAVAMSAGAVDGLNRVLARVDSQVFDLSPYLYAGDDGTGHRTLIFDFKNRHADEWTLECVADSTTKSMPCGPHENLLERFQCILEQAGGNG